MMRRDRGTNTVRCTILRTRPVNNPWFSHLSDTAVEDNSEVSISSADRTQTCHNDARRGA